ncbi:MAG: IucA/IucC family C-terminal-domain containing protein, partial [Thiohalorhabdaceae bacterium]
LHLMEEPGFLTVDLPVPDGDERRRIAEGFGLILRRGLQDFASAGSTPYLAGALFAERPSGVPRARDWCAFLARRRGGSLTEVTEAWFADYVRLLLPPMLYAFFGQGVVFEPHQQNVLVALADGWPDRIALRDLEGLKLVRGRFPAHRMAHVDSRTQESFWYEAERGWDRLAYCLLVNQLCEAIPHLAEGAGPSEARLWQVVARELKVWQATHGDSRSRIALDALLAGAPLPAKANLLTRFRQDPDRASGYIPLANPMAQEAAPWS